MNLTPYTYQPTFKALYVSPSGKEAIKEYDECWLGINLKGFVKKTQDQRAEDKHVDGTIIGVPDEYHNLLFVLKIHDKETDEVFKGPFRVDSPYSFVHHTIKTEDGRDVPPNVAVLKDSNGKKRYFTFEDSTHAERFVNCAEGHDPHGNLGLGVIEAMERYYRNIYEEKESPKDKYADLMSSVRAAYKKPLHKIVPQIMTEENLLGKGREKDVYKIDKLPDYVFCVVREKYNPEKPITPFHQCFQTNSVTDTDLPIMMNDNGMYVKKYIGGKSHSLPNWLDKFTGKEPLKYEDVQYFMNSLEELSKFPARSYVAFATSLQKLNKERIRIDTVNPNNIIIDKDLQTIKMIDFGSGDNKVPLGTMRPINGLSDMEAILCDSIMFTRLYDMATDEDKEKLDEYAKKIIEKCRIAAKVSNIGNFPPNTKLYAERMEEQKESRRGDLIPRLRAFRKFFKNVLSKEVVSTEFEGYPPSIKEEILAKLDED